MTDEKWTDADDASLNFAAIPEDHPVKLTTAVIYALDALHREGVLETLAAVVTPESRDAWGDFSAAASALDGDYGINSVARSWPSAPDVVYVWLMEHEPTARMITKTEAVVIPHTFTWVWRPELGGWRLHGIGTSIPPEMVPRTSPGQAPDIGAIAPHVPG